MVKASASGAEDPGFESRLPRDFSGSSHTSDLKIGTPVATLLGSWCYRVSAGTSWPGGTPVATLPGAWRYMVCAGTGRPGVSIL